MSTSEDSGRPETMNPGSISWAELVTADPAAAIAYYTELFGWTTQPFRDDYTMFVHEGRPFAGVIKSPMPDVPTHWKNYVVVDDIEASIGKSTELGGELCWGPETIETVGRIAIILDPTGAVIGLHELE